MDHCPPDFRGYGDQPLDGPVIDLFVGDAITLPLTWWQVAPVYGTDGKTVVTPGTPVNMTGMQPGAEFLTYGQTPGQGAALAVSNFVPLAATWTVTGPGRGQVGDLTSGLVRGPARINGPRIRSHYTDAAGQHTHGTYYLRVR